MCIYIYIYTWCIHIYIYIYSILLSLGFLVASGRNEQGSLQQAVRKDLKTVTTNVAALRRASRIRMSNNTSRSKNPRFERFGSSLRPGESRPSKEGAGSGRAPESQYYFCEQGGTGRFRDLKPGRRDPNAPTLEPFRGRLEI